MNISNIPYWIWAGPCFLRINSFTYGFVAYVSTHLFVYTYSLISNKKKHNSDTKHITSQNQTYYFNYFIARIL